MSTETAVVLYRAADLLEEYGWCQHTARDVLDGRICAVTAVLVAANERGTSPKDAVVAVLHHLSVPRLPGRYRLHGAREAGALTVWNDAPGRSRREVTDALRGAALSS